jgi:hypothetical protein
MLSLLHRAEMMVMSMARSAATSLLITIAMIIKVDALHNASVSNAAVGSVAILYFCPSALVSFCDLFEMLPSFFCIQATLTFIYRIPIPHRPSSVNSVSVRSLAFNVRRLLFAALLLQEKM